MQMGVVGRMGMGVVGQTGMGVIGRMGIGEGEGGWARVHRCRWVGVDGGEWIGGRG